MKTPKRRPATKEKNTVTMGVELETYSIAIPEYRICRDLRFPKRSSIERGEHFIRDWSIGSEYNSKVFTSIREALFLLKSGLRKYTAYRKSKSAADRFVIFPIGGWSDRFAGTHIHLAVSGSELQYDEARKLSSCLHGHLPFLAILSANSPVWREKITPFSSNRLIRGSDKYCQVTKRGTLPKKPFREIMFNQGRKKKAPTLEIRVMDSSIPEYIVAALCVARAVAMSRLKRKPPFNRSTHENYLAAREYAINSGKRARLVWSNHWMNVPRYVDLFFRKYAEELREMDIPEEILDIFRYLKKGWNQARVIREAARKCRARHRPTWQRRFAKKYAAAIEELLNGNSFERFARRLGIRLPNISRTWLGRKEARW